MKKAHRHGEYLFCLRTVYSTEGHKRNYRISVTPWYFWQTPSSVFLHIANSLAKYIHTFHQHPFIVFILTPQLCTNSWRAVRFQKILPFAAKTIAQLQLCTGRPRKRWLRWRPFCVFLDVQKISSICSKRGLVFQYRLVVNADDTADLGGELKPHIIPASYYEACRKIKCGNKLQSSKVVPTQNQKRSIKTWMQKLGITKIYTKAKLDAVATDEQIRDLKTKRSQTNVDVEPEELNRRLNAFTVTRCQTQSSMNVLKIK